MPALQGSAAGIIWEGAVGQFVIGCGQLDGLAGFQIVQSEIDGAPTIVARALRGIGYENLALGWRGVPENLRYIPRTIGVVNEQSVAVGLEVDERVREGCSRWALEEGACLRVHRSAEEIVVRGIADVQMNGRV